MNDEADVSLEFHLERTPAEAGTDIYRWSERPLAGVNFIEGRVMPGGWGPIRREASDEQGNHRAGRASVEINDADRLVRNWLNDPETQHLEHREAACKIHTREGRFADEARSLFRGPVVDVTHGRRITRSQWQETARFELTDAIGPYLDRLIPQHVFTAEDFPGIDPALLNTPIPLIGGEHSDEGAEDAVGASATKGMIPAIYVGMRRTVDDDPTSGIPALLIPPSLSGVVVGTAGTTPWTYGITAHSAYGETTVSAGITVAGPATLSATNYITLSWDPVADATGYTIYGRTNPSPVRRLASVGPDVTSYNDIGAAAELAPGPPGRNTAQIPGVDGAFFWDFYVVALGVVEITAVYGSDVAAGTTPARMNLNDMSGVDLLIPGFDGWPHGQDYLTTPSGLRITGFYARGPRSDHHVTGVVTFAVQTCGYEDVGDGSGNAIQEAFPMLQHFLNEFVLKDGGLTYRTGDWGPLEAFPSDPAITMLQTSKFAAAQDLTREWLGTAEGYYGAIYLGEQITVREFLQLFNLTFGSFTAVNHHGQLYPFLIDDAGDPEVGRVYRERIEIKRLEAPEIDRDQIENPIRYQFDYDPDGRRFRSDVLRAYDELAFVNQKGTTRDRGVRLCLFTRDAATAMDAQTRWHRRMKYARRLQGLVTNYHGLSDEPGDQVLIGHRGALGDGTTALRPYIVLSHEVDPNTDEVRLVCLDVHRLLTGVLPLLEDEGSMIGNLGDETSSAPPPVGAFELS